MRGHIRQRGKRWEFCLDVGSDPKSGRRRQKWFTGYATKRDAQRALNETISRLDNASYVAPTKLTVGAFMREWLDAMRAQVRVSTWASYRTNVEAHIVPRLGAVRLQQLAPAQLNAFYADLLAGGRRDGRGGLNPGTVAFCHTLIHRALRDAVRWGRVVRNVADLADPPRRRRAEMRVWTAAQLRDFLAHVSGDRLYAAWVVASMTGLRRGELLGLRWSDVDLDAARLSIAQALVLVNNRATFAQPKTTRGRRTVSVDDVTVAALRAHRTRQLEERLAAGPAYHDSGLVFTIEDGRYVHPNTFSAWFEQRVHTSGLPAIRLHDLRHTAASIMLSAGVPAKVASERLGHSSVSITLDTYSHVLPGMQEDAAAKVAKVVFGA